MTHSTLTRTKSDEDKKTTTKRFNEALDTSEENGSRYQTNQIRPLMSSNFERRETHKCPQSSTFESDATVRQWLRPPEAGKSKLLAGKPITGGTISPVLFFFFLNFSILRIFCIYYHTGGLILMSRFELTALGSRHYDYGSSVTQT